MSVANNKTARVFLLEPGQNVDVSHSANFGILTPIFEKKDFRPNVWSNEFADEFVRRLDEHKYNPNLDYMLIAGHMVPLTICVANIVREWGDECDKIKFLLWDSKRFEYVPMEL